LIKNKNPLHNDHEHHLNVF